MEINGICLSSQDLRKSAKSNMEELKYIKFSFKQKFILFIMNYDYNTR